LRGWRELRRTDRAKEPSPSLRADAALYGFAADRRCGKMTALSLDGWGARWWAPALRSAGVEPLLVKGWAVARLYPERGIRPYGDIDLCVRPEQHGVAVAALATLAAEAVVVDLHEGLPQLHRPSLEDVFERSQLVQLGEYDVRILGSEDHLRYMWIHM
jgi:hypothetical protein